ncbi:MAG: ABC transporter permease [Halofilum sp. (in: g-proteobacteria)]|nr:ABC transporter permease [Halofilum sp. (in: g-proteobacteria)]
MHRLRGLVRNPYGRPRMLMTITWAYMIWTIVPVVIAISFSFNDGRSISVWQGFDATRWYWGDAVNSVWHDPGLRAALFQSLKLAALDVLIATPIGVLLALGLARWRGYGSRPANFLMLFPLITPEIVMGVSLYLVFQYVYTAIDPSTTAQVLGQVTFSISYVVIVVRGRLLSIGRQYEEAAADLGATPWESLRLVLLPLMLPAILASMMIVFAISIDNFVIAQWLSCGAGCDTVPIKVYNATRSAPLPSINAVAALMVYLTLAAVILAYALYRFLTRGERAAGSSRNDLAKMGSIDFN